MKAVAKLFSQWIKFLSGDWTRERPTNPGTYPVEAVECGDHRGVTLLNTITLVEQDGGLVETRGCSEVSWWRGWWWSEPLPRLPPTPDAVFPPMNKADSGKAI